MGLPCDWQISKQKISERGQYLLETGQWSDCNFIVGQEPHQQTLKGHKLFLAMSSPVFEAMFFGGMAEKNDPIPIPDVQPEAFKALLEYIYTDRVDLGSFELGCELCYCAKKYMLPSLVEKCTKYLWSDLSPKKACRAYEFAKLFEEPVLMEKCLQIICTKTNEVLKETSWKDVELGTLLTVLEQENLQINSEIELFYAVECWAKAECARKSLDVNDRKSLKSVIGNALLKIRFLSLTPQEFAEGPGMSLLLTKDEAFAILMNILCTGNKAPMPEGFSTNMDRRVRAVETRIPSQTESYFRLGGPHYYEPNTYFRHGQLRENNIPAVVLKDNRRESPKYCLRSVLEEIDCLNTNVLDSSVTFSVDKNICILGVQVPTQIPVGGNNMNHVLSLATSYTEILYAHLLDSDGARLTYTHFTTKVNTNTLVEITFNRPIYIQKNKVYRVGVVFNKVGWYPMGVCTQSMTCDTVLFSFGIGQEVDSVRDGLIRSIIFTQQSEPYI
ncbi:BTB/POZ domain-containing protein 2-like [Hylaeus anthracinus]|uniref:BTB/POZ domain-containing protein 2-like n=1 Tax=Hylaeus volcanicus TaxID=313075 RepID=UPI0023B7CDE4|nr:BTB/POZ domain-containing protein 2-like [Hylaeus volcanicus]XP_054006284.1 BTB/POZ domain-containing protein 2-like [Hylaeus anthracinus]